MRISTGAVKLRSTVNGLQFNVPDIIGEAAQHLVGKTFRCALISGVDRDVISFTHVRPKTEEPQRPMRLDPVHEKESILEIRIGENGRSNIRTWSATPKVAVKEVDPDDLSVGHVHWSIRNNGVSWDEMNQSQKAEYMYDMACEKCHGRKRGLSKLNKTAKR